MRFIGNPTFKQVFNIEVPDGVLFHPRCGKNTYESISLFIDSISIFHFADINRVELPVLECGTVKSGGEMQTQSSIRSDDISRGFISANIVNNAFDEGTKHFTFEIGDNFKSYFNIDIGSITIKDTLKKQVWKLNMTGKEEIKIYSHSLDSALALFSIKNIAVYFDGSRSKRKGGNLCNLKSDLVEIVIDKMVDRGFILTREELIEDTRLDYIGYCGKIGSPLHVWQVRKL